jgi:crossover junction endodeoxyribonuclease RuvC
MSAPESPAVPVAFDAAGAAGSTLRICGLDLSLTSTGFARVCGTDVLIERLQPGKRKGHERLEYLRTAVGDRCHDADLVVIEGPSYGSTGGREHERGGLWWLIAHTLWREAVPYAVCPPAVLKRYACGRGNADKDQVLASVIRRYPDVMVSGNDTADALVLAAMGARHLGCPLEVALPANHLDAMAKVDWPALARTGGAR